MSFEINIKETKPQKKAGMTLNQIHKNSGTSESFKDWLKNEQATYQKKVDDGKIQGQMPFESWMKNRWRGKFNATGESTGSKLLGVLENVGKDALTKTLQQAAGVKTPTAANPSGAPSAPAPVYEKRILGMKPAVFWSVAIVGGIALTYGTVVVIKKIRKK